MTAGSVASVNGAGPGDNGTGRVVDGAGHNGDGTGPNESDIRLGRQVAAAAMVSAFLVVLVVHAALPASPFELLPPGAKKAVIAMAPEGWSFFTKSPRDPSPVLYWRAPNGGWHSGALRPLARPGRLFGLDRAGRAQNTEIALLMDAVPPGAWRTCEQGPAVCLADAPSAAVVANGSHRTVCGDVGIVVQEVLPWAWRDAPTVMPSKVVRVWVAC
jgi:antimicrobial peptide system SdpA family protein